MPFASLPGCCSFSTEQQINQSLVPDIAEWPDAARNGFEQVSRGEFNAGDCGGETGEQSHEQKQPARNFPPADERGELIERERNDGGSTRGFWKEAEYVPKSMKGEEKRKDDARDCPSPRFPPAERQREIRFAAEQVIEAQSS